MTELSNAKPGAWNLYDVATALTDGTEVWAALFDNILTRQIEFHVAPGTSSMVRNINVMKLDQIAGCRRSTADQEEIFDDVLLGTGEVGFYLGTRQSEICSFIRSGYLNAEHLTLRTVKEFRSTYICGGELLAFLRLTAKPGDSVSSWGTLRRMKSKVKLLHDRPSLRSRAAVKQFFADLG
ncbi:hypothetical protein [Rhizobium mongolense]|uniref:Uncharacterized protein n=1 Tax=Rhizobium mongolense TaxID=57676 RepID=A0ABR6ILW8_9HYPH|nr:hypothetical protein [Rhizobium mongolense]MBB4228877.1 hypothetical protein [Rhizobium mongolense]